jgi:hypothetical protein
METLAARKWLKLIMAVLITTTERVDITLAIAQASADSNIAQATVSNTIAAVRTPLNLTVNPGGKVWYKYATVNSGSFVDYDLTALTDISGLAVSFASIHGLLITNKQTTAGKKIKLPAGGANPWTAFLDATQSVELDAGGALLICNPNVSYGVDATHKTLRITQSSGAVNCDFEIFIFGE